MSYDVDFAAGLDEDLEALRRTDPDAAREWLEPGPLPAELLVPYPAEEMQAWRVGDDAKSTRIEPHPSMAEPVAA